MRKQYTQILKEFFYQKVFRSRVELGITQEEMAHRLAMSSRTYVELDHGKSGSSALTLALYLIYICSAPLEFLEELRNAFESESNWAA